MKTLVLAIGNTLLTDEGVGIHALQALQDKYPEPEGVTYMDGGSLSFTLAGAVEDTDNLIVIDATQLKSKPGTVDCNPLLTRASTLELKNVIALKSKPKNEQKAFGKISHLQRSGQSTSKIANLIGVRGIIAIT